MLKQSGNAIVWSYDGETLRAEPWGDASVRVRAVKMGKIGQAPDWTLLPSENTEIDITETEYEGLKALCLKNGKISVIVQENGRVTILDRNGKKLLQEFVRDRTVRGTDFSALMISAREFMPNPGGNRPARFVPSCLLGFAMNCLRQYCSWISSRLLNRVWAPSQPRRTTLVSPWRFLATIHSASFSFACSVSPFWEL